MTIEPYSTPVLLDVSRRRPEDMVPPYLRFSLELEPTSWKYGANITTILDLTFIGDAAKYCHGWHLSGVRIQYTRCATFELIFQATGRLSQQKKGTCEVRDEERSWCDARIVSSWIHVSNASNRVLIRAIFFRCKTSKIVSEFIRNYKGEIKIVESALYSCGAVAH